MLLVRRDSDGGVLIRSSSLRVMAQRSRSRASSCSRRRYDGVLAWSAPRRSVFFVVSAAALMLATASTSLARPA